jgi:DNA (cytosine-5)-methyltransferase 1
MATASEIVALDLFAGTGWGVACRQLGIREHAVEIMPEAIATRAANGMDTLYHDVWEGLDGRHYVPPYSLLIGSPPCQTYSMGGKGSGRRALGDVLAAIDAGAYKDPAALRALGLALDPRTALVLAPLAHVWRDRPKYVVLEQVPPVLPVWEACAKVMRAMGYSVQVAVLNSEQYGVPQTRRRAFLVAAYGQPVALPAPTHSRYYPANPSKLDPGLLPWVSMADALGLETPGPTLRSNYGTGGDASNRGRRLATQPAPTVTSKADRNKWNGEQNMTVEQAAALQTYPALFDYPAPAAPDPGGMVLRNGNMARAAVRATHQPAPTIHFGHNSARVQWIDPAHADDPQAPGQRVTIEEAAVLQTYERPFIWCGNKGKQFLQIGNAVPPLLARTILQALIR